MTEDAIPVLRVAVVDTAVKWYELLGFTTRWPYRDESEGPSFAEIVRGDAHIFLSENHEDVQPGTLVYLRVPDVEAIAMEFGATPEDLPWAREMELHDPDGNRIRIGTPTV